MQHDHARQNNRLSAYRIAQRLRSLISKREKVACEYDQVLVRQLTRYISELAERCNLHVAIGRLKDIRAGARCGAYKSPRFRDMIHSWTFARITEDTHRGE